MAAKIKLFDSFAGIGALHKALKNIGVDVELVGMSEIDIEAIRSYNAIHYNNKWENVELPSKEEMENFLKERNIGLDFKTGKCKLPKGEKLKEVYRICKALNNYGDISLIKPEDLPDFDLFNFSFPCFPKGALVLTNKGYKEIQDITNEDIVLTHTNNYQKVIKPMKRKYSGNIYKIATMCSEDILVTDEHPFYVRKKSKIWDADKRVYNRVFEKPEWVKAKDLTKDYYVGIAINTKNELPKWEGVLINSTYAKLRHKKLLNNLNNYFDKKEFWWIVGYYIGNGYVTHYIDKKNTSIYNLYLTGNYKKIEKVKERLNILNANNDFNYKIYKQKTCYKLRIANVEFANYLMQFGKYAENKHLTQDIFNLPVELLREFLDGYFNADGSYDKKKKIYRCSSVSKELIYGIGEVIAKAYNRPYSIYKYDRGDKHIIENRIPCYSLHFKKEINKQDKAFYEDGYVWCPINKITTEFYDDYVYNMEVDKDNSYTVNNIIVHNCTDISVAGQQKGLVDEEGNLTRSGLYVYGMEILKIKKPKYVMIENVKNLISKKFKPYFDKMLEDLDKIGYNTYWKVLNAKDYGIPQNRERVFVICIRKDIDTKGYEFPKPFDNGLRLKHLLDNVVDEKYYIEEERTQILLNQLKDNRKGIPPSGNKIESSHSLASREHRTSGWKEIVPTLCARDYKDPKVVSIPTDIEIRPCLSPDRINKRQNGRRFKEKDEPSFTLTTQDRHGVLIKESKCVLKGDKWDKMHDICKRVYSEEDCSLTIHTYNGGNTEPKILVDDNKCEISTGDDESTNNLKFIGGIENDKELSRNYKQGYRVYDVEGIACTQIANGGGLGAKTGLYLHNYKIRKLTPIECYRLMGFKDEDIKKVKDIGMSDTKMYKQAGNSIVVNVLEEIFKNLF